MARKPPPYQSLPVEFTEQAFPGRATIAFEANSTADSGPAGRITVEAGRRGTWRVEFVPGRDLPAGARVAFAKLENEFRFAWRHQDYWPDAKDYVTVEDGDAAALPFECETRLKSRTPAVVTLPREFGAGRRIVLRMGDQRAGGPGSSVRSTCYENARIRVGVALPGESVYRVSDTVSVRVVPCPPVGRYYVFGPSQAAVGQEVRALALPLDVNGNIIEPARPPVLVSPSGGATQAERTDDGAFTARVTFSEPDGSGIGLQEGPDAVDVVSNPTRAADGTGYNVYWGEFHCHGYDGVEINVLNENTHPDRAYRYGREATRLDFCAMGSHIFRHAPEAVHEWWDLYRDAAEAQNRPGRYVTFLGCEWRDTEPEGGDRNLVWRDLDAPPPEPTWKIEEIYERFAGRGAMVVPHVGGTPATPSRHDPGVESLCEMVSGHGQFEWFAQAYLSKGCRLGLIGGSDGHKGTPGHPRVVSSMGGGRFARTLRERDAGWSGGPILAVLAEELTRDSLWRAFRERRTYATTGARALLDFRVNGSPMGSEVSAERDVELAVSISGTAPLWRVDLIRGDRRLRRWDCGSATFAETIVDRPPDGETYYYARVEQRDGEMLWSSPVWVDSRCGGAPGDLPAWKEPEDIDLDAVADEEAGRHLGDLLDYLRREENPDAFTRITPYRTVRSPLGRYAVFLGYLREKRVRIHWFPDFEMPRIRLEVGWVQYGRERIWGAPWSAHLFDLATAM